MFLARRVNQIQASQTLAITNLVDSLRREGRDIIDLGAGEPDFETPQLIKEAGIEAIQRGYTKYTHSSGSFELRQAICEKLKRENGLDYAPSEIIVTCGAKHAIINVLLALCQEGDEVILQSPYWTSYLEQIRLVDATPVILPTDESSGFKFSPRQLQQAITPRTKLLIINSPSNPTGAVYSPSELSAMAEVLKRSDVFILTDEIYEKLIYDNEKHQSLAAFPELQERTIVVNGVSKAYSMTGWRIGYLAAKSEIVQAASKIQSHMTSNATSISQWASIAALRANSKIVEEMAAEFAQRRNYLFAQLRELPGINCVLPKGAFYLFPNISAYFGLKYQNQAIQSALDFCSYLLEEEGVALVPGEAFGSNNNVRISYATSMVNLQEAVLRMERGLRKLRN
jgi:aspartate aminotransferase